MQENEGPGCSAGATGRKEHRERKREEAEIRSDQIRPGEPQHLNCSELPENLHTTARMKSKGKRNVSLTNRSIENAKFIKISKK